MNYKYIHLIIKSHVRFSLKNLIGSNKGHKIFIIEENTFKDIDGNKISNKEFNLCLHNSEVVFAHFLSGDIANIINSLSSSKKIIWFCWGGDLYNLGKLKTHFLKSETKKLYYKLGFKSFNIFKNILKGFLGPLIDYFPPNKTILSAIKRTDIIVPVVPGDYNDLKEKYNVKAKVFNLNYINNVFFKQPKLNESAPKKDILLGNSAYLTNNHVEVINLLSNTCLKNRIVHIPLTYGRTKYANYIKKYAQNKLESNLHILDKRLPLDKYMDLIANCEFVIMNHCRQQAMGNIFLAFWFEASLYLNPGTNHFQVLTERGFKVFNVSEFSPENRLTTTEKKRNKELLIKWYGPNYLQEQFNKLLSQIDAI